MAEWDDYEYREEGWKKYLEGLIPLIILILIGVIIASRMGWIDIPFLRRDEIVQIAVLGDLRAEGVNEPAKVDAPHLAAYLDERYEYEVTTWRDLEILEFTGQELLDEFDLVILAGERSVSPRVKGEIGNYIGGGGKVIAVGDAAIHDPEYPEVVGWDVGDLEGTFPIGVGYTVERGEIDDPETIISTEEDPLTFTFLTTEHDIQRRAGIGIRASFDEIEEVREECKAEIVSLPIRPQTGGDVLSVITGTSSVTEQTKTIIGMAEKKGALGRGHVMYFPYDPGCLPTIFDETVGYMLGRTF